MSDSTAPAPTDSAVDKPTITWTSTQQVISFVLVGAFVMAIFSWMFWPPRNVDQSALTVLNMLLGALVAKFTTVIDFFFGSSQGSKDKDDAQAKIMERLTPPASPPTNGTAPLTPTAAPPTGAS